jgi:hypothetical protein
MYQTDSQASMVQTGITVNHRAEFIVHLYRTGRITDETVVSFCIEGGEEWHFQWTTSL